MILICYGTRPEWIKIKPLVKEFEDRGYPHKILFTGQQKDIAPSQNSHYKYEMQDMSNNRLDSIIKNCMSMPEKFFEGVDKVLVQGDTATAFGLALAAFHRKIKIVHLEAGLRTRDLENPYPEEAYRQMIARIADIHLCPTSHNEENIRSERCISENIHVVGNTSIDNLKSYDLEVKTGNTVLITLHRRENHDIMEEWFFNIEKLAKDNLDLQFLLPIHPNPNVIKHRNKLSHVKVIDPMDHESLVKQICSSRLVITDSGGIQEEASFYNKRVIVCRKITERVESLGISSFICKEPKDLSKLFYDVLKSDSLEYECPYGDGNSSNRIVDILLSYE